MKRVSFLCLFILSVSTHSQQITVVNARDISDMENFYQCYSHEPIIIKDVYANDRFIASLTPEEVERIFRAADIFGYKVINDGKSKKRVALCGNKFFEDYKNGAKKYRVIDHTVTEGPLVERIKPPNFLEDNWLDELKTGWGLNFTLSGAGSFTPFHEDGDGEQAWMYLVYGRKEWVFYPPAAREFLFNPETTLFFNQNKDELSMFPELAKIKRLEYTGVAEGGDLIWFPPGWIHQVTTSENSFGFGGNIINEFLLDESVRTALIERETDCQSEFDLEALIKSLGSMRVKTEFGRNQFLRALERYEEWDRRYPYGRE